jgi:hypothetical protein
MQLLCQEVTSECILAYLFFFMAVVCVIIVYLLFLPVNYYIANTNNKGINRYCFQIYISEISRIRVITKLPKVKTHNYINRQNQYGHRARLECGRSWVRAPSGQTKDYAIGICCFSTKHTLLRRKSKDWFGIRIMC